MKRSVTYLESLSRVNSILYILTSLLGEPPPDLAEALTSGTPPARKTQASPSVDHAAGSADAPDRDGRSGRSLPRKEVLCHNRQLSPQAETYLEQAKSVLPQRFVEELAKYDITRNLTIAAHLHRGTGLDIARASRLDRCFNSHLLFESLFKMRILLVPYACHSVSCLHCAVERSAAYYRRARQVIDSIPVPHLDLRHIVFTVRNTPLDSLAWVIPAILKAFRQLRRYKLWKNHVRGYLWNFEVTYNPTARTWHPHIHVLADGLYIPQRTLSSTWARFAARRSLYADPESCTHISRVQASDSRDLASAIHETTKYFRKPFAAGTPPGPMLELTDALRGPPDGDYVKPTNPPRYRLRGTAGTLKLRPVPDAPAEYNMLGGLGNILIDRDSPLWTDDDFAREFVVAISRHPQQMPYLIRAYPMIADLIAAANPDHAI